LAALGEAVIVVQAAIRSGSLITAKEATGMGIPVYAMPGSAGTDLLLAGGRACPIFQSDQVLDTLWGNARGVERLVPNHAVHTMGPLLTVLAEGMGTPEGLSSRLGRPLSSILALLAEAELEGFVRRVGGNYYEVIGRASC
jgi:DNA processing protein